MILLGRLLHWLGAKSIAQSAAEIASRCHPSVQHVARGRIAEMTPAEQRGYVRAIATPIVRSEVNDLLARESRLGGWARERLLEQASSTLVLAVLADVRVYEWRRGQVRQAA